MRKCEKNFWVLGLRNDSACMPMPVNLGYRPSRCARDDDCGQADCELPLDGYIHLNSPAPHAAPARSAHTKRFEIIY
jgi:hypothetical protein